MNAGDTFEELGTGVRYSRVGDASLEADVLKEALDLARKVEDLLEATRSQTVPVVVDDPRVHSLRIARAMAASLVDELAALVVPSSKSGSS